MCGALQPNKFLAMSKGETVFYQLQVTRMLICCVNVHDHFLLTLVLLNLA